MDYVLFESAPGYALFEVLAAEDVGSLVDSMQESIADLSKFSKVVRLTAFVPFKSAEDALENINALSEGVLHDDLRSFLTTYVPANKVLGVSEDKLASAIAEQLGIQCNKSRLVVELQRGIRLHFQKFLKELKEGDLAKAQLGLGHSYSRSKVKFNVNRADNMIIQSICLLDQLEKDVNTLSMRVREWYSWHFPELLSVVSDNYQYAQCVRTIGKKESIGEETVAALTGVLSQPVPGSDAAVPEGEGEQKALRIAEAAKTSMGYEISDLDLASIMHFADRVVHLAEYKRSLHDYLLKKMTDIAPNLSALIGEVIGARLISHAGSLTNLAKYPASTVQILGAEKALFRALKSRGKTPKYGLIYHSTFIGRAGAKNKGRISRYLANKASIAARIDTFAEPGALAGGPAFGQMLRQQVEERLEFYDSGKVPRKNVICMQEAATEAASAAAAAAAAAEAAAEPKKRKSKGKKKSTAAAAPAEEAVAEEAPVAMEEIPAAPEEKKKKKRKSKAPTVEAEAEPVEAMEVVEAPKTAEKKKRKSQPQL